MLFGQELLDFVHPVSGQSGRTHHEGRQRRAVGRLGALVLLGPPVVVSRQHADGLQSLAQTHVVTQDPVQVVAVQKRQPVDAGLNTRVSCFHKKSKVCKV
jgi:hypothetical protein